MLQAGKERLISKKEQHLILQFLHGNYLTARWLSLKFSTSWMAYHKILSIAMNYRLDSDQLAAFISEVLLLCVL